MAVSHSVESTPKNQLETSNPSPNLSGDFVLPPDPCRDLTVLALIHGAYIDQDLWLCKTRHFERKPLYRISRVMLHWLIAREHVVWFPEMSYWRTPLDR